MRLAAALLLAALLLAAPAAANERRPSLAELESELICPTCATTLDQSRSPIADRMRAFVRERIAAGDSKSQIKDALVAQFGRGVLASPPKEGFDLVVWVLPPAGAALAAGVLGVLAWRWSRRRAEPAAAGAPAPLDPELERRVDEELARFDG
jgi:cytochrome c-type biogenesis protein CcmH